MKLGRISGYLFVEGRFDVVCVYIHHCKLVIDSVSVYICLSDCEHLHTLYKVKETSLSPVMPNGKPSPVAQAQSASNTKVCVLQYKVYFSH